jgi:hypothetical protein
MEIWFWGFTDDMEIHREHEKGGRCGGRFRSLIPSRAAGDDLGFDRWRGGKGEDPEAANRRDNGVKMRALSAVGNIKNPSSRCLG